MKRIGGYVLCLLAAFGISYLLNIAYANKLEKINVLEKDINNVTEPQSTVNENDSEGEKNTTEDYKGKIEPYIEGCWYDTDGYYMEVLGKDDYDRTVIEMYDDEYIWYIKAYYVGDNTWSYSEDCQVYRRNPDTGEADTLITDTCYGELKFYESGEWISLYGGDNDYNVEVSMAFTYLGSTE